MTVSNTTTNSITTTSSVNSNNNYNQLYSDSQEKYLEIILNNIKNRQYILDELFRQKVWLQCYINIGIILCFYFILIIFFLFRRISRLDIASAGTTFILLTFICFIFIGREVKSTYDKINDYESDNINISDDNNGNNNNITASEVNNNDNNNNNNCHHQYHRPHTTGGFDKKNIWYI